MAKPDESELIAILRMFVYPGRQVSDKWIRNRSLYEALREQMDCSKLIKFAKRHWGHQEMLETPNWDNYPDEFVYRHNTDDLDEKRVFDKRCPRCRFDRMSAPSLRSSSK